MEDVTPAERARHNARHRKTSEVAARRLFVISGLFYALLIAAPLVYFGSGWLEGRQKAAEAKRIAGLPPAWGEWNESMHIGIARALVKAKAKGCGQLKWRSDTIHRGKYLVRCTRDGREWFEWHVDEYRRTADGPNFLNPAND